MCAIYEKPEAFVHSAHFWKLIGYASYLGRKLLKKKHIFLQQFGKKTIYWKHYIENENGGARSLDSVIVYVINVNNRGIESEAWYSRE